MKLSILICSLGKRAALLRSLLNDLNSQKTDEVEILHLVDNGKLTTGAKRNRLLGMASGDYISFVDDDDLVSGDYVTKILTALVGSPDCCSLQGELTYARKKTNNKFIFKHSLKYDHWYSDNGIYYRCPNHLNTVKREIALQVGFPELNVNEDRVYSNSLYSLLKTETEIDGTIYFYRK